MKGKIIFIRPRVQRGKMRARLVVKIRGGGFCEAFLPERELAALLPRSLLLVDQKEAPFALLAIINAMLKRMTVGRIVRLHEVCGEYYVTFLSWQRVRFKKELSEKNTTSA